MIIPVILAGGSGSRLWPASRSLYPKQFLNLIKQDKSLFQQTLERLDGYEQFDSPIIVCNDEHRFLVAEQLRAINKKPVLIVLEPVGRNTAPAVALAALFSIKINKNSTLLILPADHIIEDISAFFRAIDQGIKLAEENKLVTFGTNPTHPEVGYGYIKKGERLHNGPGFEINSFVEKPNLSLAKEYLSSGSYLWNSGMFLFKATAYMNELHKYNLDMAKICEQSVITSKEDLDFIRVDKSTFKSCPSDSIDYAVMEKTNMAAVIPFDAKWSDIGAWHSLWEISEKDQNGNSIVGDVLAEDTHNTLIRAESRHVAAIGLDNHIIVETADAILIAEKSHASKVKTIVNLLKANNRNEINEHKRVFRPWGWYESICFSNNFQVKRIQVKPGGCLSLQKHHYRAEHWVVVKGKAKVTNGNEVKIYEEDQSTYIPIGNKHRLENIEKTSLEIIEIQTGSYLGEDDIVRFEDNYGR